MPKYSEETTEMQQHALSGGFGFSSVGMERLGASEYTVVGIDVDITGSTHGFEKGLHDALESSVLSLKKSPRAANLLVRVTQFNSSIGVEELHGFKPLSEIDVATVYPSFQPGGMTNLVDAAYASISAIEDYGSQLVDNDYNVNGIAIIITDGYDNQSKMTAASIRNKVEELRKNEKLESMLTILVGVNAADCKAVLEKFQKEAGIDKYIALDDVSPAAMAKLAGFIAQSVSSQSQALGTGGPSQYIAATI